MIGQVNLQMGQIHRKVGTYIYIYIYSFQLQKHVKDKFLVEILINYPPKIYLF